MGRHASNAMQCVTRMESSGYTWRMNSTQPKPAASASAKSERGQRLSPDDWVHGAIELIAEQGVSGLAVEPLARRLGVTKGSFYWHFPSRDALLQMALETWELEEQRILLSTLEGVKNPADRLRALTQLVSHEVKLHGIYSELVKAMSHPIVNPVVERLSKSRLAYLTTLFRDAGLDEHEAPHRARLTYAAYIGLLQLNMQIKQFRLQAEEFEAYVKHVMETLIPNIKISSTKD